MKKFINNLSVLCLLGVLCVACKGDYDDWAQPQHNEQEQPDAVTMTVDVVAPASVIEIENLGDADQVQVFVPVKVESNVDTKYVLTLSDDKGNSKDLNVTNDGYISKDELVNIIVEYFGKKQLERSLTGVLTALYVKDGTTMKVTSEKFTVRVLPAVPEMNYWIYGKQNNRDGVKKTLPLMPVSKEVQTVTTYFSGSLDTKLWSDDNYDAEKGQFDLGVPFGAASGNNVKAMSGEFKDGGGYICPKTAGWYTLTFNFADYKFTFERLENQSPTEYTSVSLIGDFNQWTADVEMTQVATDKDAWKSHCWYALGVELKAGGVKFRADKDWAVNWGVAQIVKDNPYGIGTQDGSNITVPDGTYNVYFNDITGEFLFIEAE